MVNEQVIDPALATERVYSPPSAYANYGYEAESDISVLNQDDRNNINYIAISQMYGKNALTLIKRNPTRYLRRVAIAYVLYSTPSSHFQDVTDEAESMGIHEFIYAFILNPAIPISMNSEWDLHLSSIILPFALLLYLGNLIRILGFSMQKWILYGRENIVIITMFTFVVYGVIFGTFFAYGENSKLKYLTEIPMIILVVAIVMQTRFRIPHWFRGKN